MKAMRGWMWVVLAAIGALLLQTTLFGRFRLAGVAPDLVMLFVILATLRVRNEPALMLAFTVGVIFDALSSTALGLRAITYVIVAYVAIRTKDRADFSPVAVSVWVALLTALGVVLFLVVGTLFSQIDLSGGGFFLRLVLVPLFNMALALMLSPLVAKLLEPSRRGL